MKNLEIKAKLKDINSAKKICKVIGAKYKGILEQTDTYFNVPEGRLKLREINSKIFELIYYFRSNIKTAGESNYEIIRLKSPLEIKKLFNRTLGIKGIIKKKRELFFYQNVRIHLDKVSGLGTFMELEIVCSNSKELKDAPRKMKFLEKSFLIKSKDLIKVSYIDLL